MAELEAMVDSDPMALMDLTDPMAPMALMALMDPPDPMVPLALLARPRPQLVVTEVQAPQALQDLQEPLELQDHPEPQLLDSEVEADSEVTHRLAVPEIGAPLPMAEIRHVEILVSLALAPLASRPREVTRLLET